MQSRFFCQQRFLVFLMLVGVGFVAEAQHIRKDAFPPEEENIPKSSLTMALSISDLYHWDCYPTYPTYIVYMNYLAQRYPHLCSLDTIGVSVKGRLILALHIHGNSTPEDAPQFFYSSTIHGDELTGYQLTLHLCDTLLSSYGTDTMLTQLLNTTHIYINPLSNPDGTYHGGDYTVSSSWRYNANRVDLNRNYPDPFGTPPLDPIQPENEAMMNYVGQHHFLMAVNIHGGDQVCNLPWDSFTSVRQQHPDQLWFQQICQRMVDSCRRVDPLFFTAVCPSGVIVGGDWYVIHNGRQDYMNYYHSIREITLEISQAKRLPADQLPHYWRVLATPLLRYIAEIHNAPTHTVSLTSPLPEELRVYPNPTTGPVIVEKGTQRYEYDLSRCPAGVYPLKVGNTTCKIIKL